MAVFEIADEITGGNEGGYADNFDDKGGETYKGIARKFWGALPLWQNVDAAKYEIGIPPAGIAYHQYVRDLNFLLEKDEQLQAAVKDFYRKYFWDKYNLSLIASQPVANWIYDHVVNAGSRGAMWAQAAAGAKDDGDIGPKSVEAINAMPPAEFLSVAKEEAKAYRIKRCKEDPSQKQFLGGWLKRDGCSTAEIAEVRQALA